MFGFLTRLGLWNLMCHSWSQLCLNVWLPNQIRVVEFNVPQLVQASFLQKKSNVAKCFFDICNAEMAQSLSSLQKSELLKLIISLVPKLRSVAQNEWNKTPIYMIFALSRKNRKKTKKNPKT